MTAAIVLFVAQQSAPGGASISGLPSAVITAAFVVALGVVLWLFLTRTILGRGFSVPLRTILYTPETAEYPEKPRPVAPRFHGRHQLNRYADGLEKCIGCELCAWACPADAIYVQGADNTVEERFSPGERYAEDYQINYNRCIFCGLCIEACPTRALTMTHEYELSADSREDLIYTKEMLLAPVPPSGRDAPHTDRAVRERGLNYYGGLAVTPPTVTGGTYDQAAPAPSARAGEVLPHGRLPTSDDTSEDPAFVGGTEHTSTEQASTERDSTERDSTERDSTERDSTERDSSGGDETGGER